MKVCGSWHKKDPPPEGGGPSSVARRWLATRRRLLNCDAKPVGGSTPDDCLDVPVFDCDSRAERRRVLGNMFGDPSRPAVCAIPQQPNGSVVGRPESSGCRRPGRA
jgi:hypothetical protein